MWLTEMEQAHCVYVLGSSVDSRIPPHGGERRNGIPASQPAMGLCPSLGSPLRGAGD